MKQILTINFTKTGLYLVRQALRTLPMNQVEDLLKDIDAQALPQLQAMKMEMDDLNKVDAAQGKEPVQKKPRKAPAKKVAKKASTKKVSKKK